MLIALRVLKILVMVIGLSHLSACIWWVVTIKDRCPEICTPEEEQECGLTWLRYYHPGFCEKTKINMYLYCLHFILATFTTVGYGDITPVQRRDQLPQPTAMF